MKRFKIIISLALLAFPMFAKGPKLTPKNIDRVVKSMTLEQKVKFLFGTGMNMGFMDPNQTKILGLPDIVTGQSSASRPVEEFSIPGIVFCDGPAGLHIQSGDAESNQVFYCTGFPVGTCLASTWDNKLIEQIGSAMGNEVHEYNVDVLLAPAMNIQRNPLCGRNFEYYSEDPLVSGKIGAAMVRGVQSQGVGTSVKHFFAGGKETNSNQNDARISQRAIREIYLRGFEILMKEADPWTLMTSYNLVNGVYTSQNPELLQDIVRDEWGYQGTIITDWWAGRNYPAQVHAGNDMIMPGRDDQYKAVCEALENGSLSEDDVDRNVRRVLQLVLRSAKYHKYMPSLNPDQKAHAALVRQAGAEGMILLKNDDTTLPLNPAVKAAVFGNTSYEFIAGGTGSGDVNKPYVIDLVQGLENAGISVNTSLQQTYREYMKEAYANAPKPEHWFFGNPKIDEMLVDPALAAEMARNNDIAVVTIGRVSGEGGDREIEGDFNLKPEEKALLRTISHAFHAAGKDMVVVLNIGGVIETASWREMADAILLAWQPGQEAGNSVADILTGRVNPSGRLAVTFPMDYFDEPSALDFPYVKMNDRIFMPGERQTTAEAGKGTRRNFDYVNYSEDIYVGYRYFNTFNHQVAYPFGYGLSYSNFDYKDFIITDKADEIEVSVKVTNTGKVAGREVVQFYVTAPREGIEKPIQELRAFDKTSLLQPGESEIVTMKVQKTDLASFSEVESAWITQEGQYKGIIARSATEPVLAKDFNIHKSIVRPCRNVLKPQHYFERLHQ